MKKSLTIHPLFLILLFTLCTARADEILAKWKLDENSGTEIKDSSPNKLHGALQNASWVQGLSGSALEFQDGGYVNFGKSEKFIFENDFSITLWVLTRNTGNQIFISKWSGQGKESGWWIGIHNGKFSFGCLGANLNIIVSETGPIPGAWTHLAAVRYEGKLQLFVNGKSTETGKNDLPAGINNADMTLGNNPVITHWKFTGIIDEVQIYQRALDEYEPEDEYNRLSRQAKKLSSPAGKLAPAEKNEPAPPLTSKKASPKAKPRPAGDTGDLQHGGFELTDEVTEEDIRSSWKNWGKSGFTITDENPYSGEYCARIDDGAAQYIINTGITPGSFFSIKFFARAQDFPSDAPAYRCALVLWWYANETGEGTHLGNDGKLSIPNSEEWIEYNHQIKIPSGAKSIKIDLKKYQHPGVLWIDEVSYRIHTGSDAADSGKTSTGNKKEHAMDLPSDTEMTNLEPWRLYRSKVPFPGALYSREDIIRAKDNIKTYTWAQNYRDERVSAIDPAVLKITEKSLVNLIPGNTPGSTFFTPCPACRDQKKPYVPHGTWEWSINSPDCITCKQCGTVFPNTAYPETISHSSEWDSSQVFTWSEAEPFTLFGLSTRTSPSAAIRANKVMYMARAAWQLAEAYVLTGDYSYASIAGKILLRFSEVYPRYLVHSGYGEYADMNPRDAAFVINGLPGNEISAAEPDRILYPNGNPWWMAGRASGIGMEAGFIRYILAAYELTRDASATGKSLFSEKDKISIEQNILLEAVPLIIADKRINNKSVGNATSAALIGIALGQPALVRFGLTLFLNTMDEWYLPDGGPSESWAYNNMTLGGIRDLGQAFRSYQDPPGYKPSSGKRIDKLSLYRDTKYKKVFEAYFHGMQGNLLFPPLADSYQLTAALVMAEFMGYNYPENEQYRALLKALYGETITNTSALAVFCRPTGYEKLKTPALHLPDYLYPDFKLGQIRSGIDGRRSMLVLCADPMGGHKHMDSLNLYYWKNNEEILSDLGYLWDLPGEIKHKTSRTVAHNTVVVDGTDQSYIRSTAFSFFHSGQRLKVMEARSTAYSQTSVYQRTVGQVSYSPEHEYIIDIFRVRGGKKFHDYVFHGIHMDYDIASPNLKPYNPGIAADFINTEGSSQNADWRITWKLTNEQFSALWHNKPGHTSCIGTGWGQRRYRNEDQGATIPYIVRRAESPENLNVFSGIFEMHPNKAMHVTQVRELPVPAAEQNNSVLLAIKTSVGTDYIVSCMTNRNILLKTPDGDIEMNGRYGFVTIRQGKPLYGDIVLGNMLKFAGKPVPLK